MTLQPSLRRHRRLAIAAALTMALARSARAEPPGVKFLLPAGVQQGQSRTIHVKGTPGTAPLRVWTSDERLQVTPDETGKQLDVIAAAETPPGVHWVRLVNDEGASELQPLIVGVLPEVSEDERSGDSPAQPLTLPLTISGVLAKSNEVDVFEITLESDQTLIASIDSRRLLTSPADVVLQLVDERGFVLAQNDDHHGIDPQIVYTANDSGRYGVRVFAFPAEPNSTIRFAGGENHVYRLTLTTGPFVDHIVPLSPQPGDSLRLTGWNLPDAQPQLTWPADPAGADRLAVAYPGSFLVDLLQSSSIAGLIEPENPAVDGVALPVPGTACGHVDRPHQTDRYRISAKKDQSLRFTVAAQAFDSPLDPVLIIRDGAGKVIREADDLDREHADVQVDVKFPADGEYTVEVTDRFGHGGMSYVYQLSVEQPLPGCRLSVKATTFTVKPGKPLEVPVTVERLNGFAGVVEIHVEGLPEGVTAAAVESAAKGDSAKGVTLKIETDGKSAFGGHVRIAGRSEGFESMSALADTPIAGLQVDQVWLTVVAAKPEEASPTAESGDGT